MIYLDNAATTKVYPAVAEQVSPYISGDKFGNPGASYSLGRETHKAVEEARATIAQLINCRPKQLIFTACGSESNSTVFFGTKDYLKTLNATEVLVSATEHDSVLKAAKALPNTSFDVKIIPVNEHGTVDISTLESMISPKTGLVSIMFVNNETGNVNDIKGIKELLDKKEKEFGHRILFHTDCVQALGFQNINAEEVGCDFMSFSAHKIHALKGVGALYVKNKAYLRPIVYGGSSQEFGFRGGTENVPGIVSFGAACNILSGSQVLIVKRIINLKKVFVETLIRENGALEKPLDMIFNSVDVYGMFDNSKVISITVKNVDSQTLIYALEANDIYISAGSACNTSTNIPSHVLTAMGMEDEDARCTIRVSFSDMLSEEDVIKAAEMIVKWGSFFKENGNDGNDKE